VIGAASAVAVSSAFYRDAFGWTLRTDDDGGVAPDAGEKIARFRDPAGNLMSIYQHGG
jgi:hypothetical protein